MLYLKWNKTNGFVIRHAGLILLRSDEKLTLAFCWPLTYDNINYQHYRLGKRTTLQVVGQFISFVCRIKNSLISKNVPVYSFLWAVIGQTASLETCHQIRIFQEPMFSQDVFTFCKHFLDKTACAAFRDITEIWDRLGNKMLHVHLGSSHSSHLSFNQI